MVSILLGTKTTGSLLDEAIIKIKKDKNLTET